MGTSGRAGTIDVSLPVAEAVDGVAAVYGASRDETPRFFHMHSVGRCGGCLTCVSLVSGGEDSGKTALLGSARAVIGNARVRGVRDGSVAEARTGANVCRVDRPSASKLAH